LFFTSIESTTMATIQPRHPSLADKGIREQEHPHWLESFRPEVRFQQLEDDHQAWARVTGILLTIVTIGVLLAVFSVSLCMLT